MTPSRLGRAVPAWLLAALVAPVAAAQMSPRPVAPAPRPVTAEQVEALRGQLEKVEGPDESATRASELLRAALDQVEVARRAQADAAGFAESIASVPAEQEAIRQELAATPDTSIAPPADATLEELRPLRDQAEAALATARDELKSLEAESARRDARRAEIPRKREELQVALEKVDSEAPGTLEGEPPHLGEARRLERAARRQAITAQLAALDRELASYDARRELLDLRRERWKARIATREQIAQKWREVVTTAERLEAERETVHAREAAEKAATQEAIAPELKEIADKNLALANLRTGERGVIARRDAAIEAARLAAEDLRRLGDRFDRARERAAAASLTELGDVQIRRARASIPDLAALRRRIEQRRQQISQAQLQLADLEGEFESLPPASVRKSSILGAMPLVRQARLEPELATLLDEQRTRYRTLIEETGAYLEALLGLQEIERQVMATAEAFQGFIDERVLWIRSTTPVRRTDRSEVLESAAWLTRPASWRGAWHSLQRAVAAQPAGSGMLAVAIVAIALTRHRAARRLVEAGREVRRRVEGGNTGTLQAIALTLAVAAAVPAVIWIVAWRLGAGEQADPFAKAIAAGLGGVASIFLALGLIRQLCRDDGLADAHFNIDSASRRALGGVLRWLLPAMLPVAFVVAALEFRSGGVGNDPLGRAVFVAGSALFTAGVGRLLRPGGPVSAALLRRRRGGWLDRLRWLWYAAAVAVPATLGLLAITGYYYSALQLGGRLGQTYWLAAVVLIVHGAVTRWLAVARWRLMRQEAQRAREQGQAETTEAGTIALKSEQLDPNAVSAQARQMLRWSVALALALGMWVTWDDMFPALTGLDRVHLWPQLRIVEAHAPVSDPIVAAAPGAAAAVAAGIAPPAPPAPPPAAAAGSGDPVITLADLAITLLILMLSMVLARNLPGLLEITILNRLPLEPGARFAMAALTRYTLVILGIVLAFNAIGIGWSKVQWLAAAVTVGLGFGLQEIFGNFVSGLIILFERPIRVGDTVTVGTVSGTVTRIRIRATTITDWDRKELIIPNKQFVTGEVINWTLSDTITRVKFKVGIAYGSDTELARRIMHDAARASAYVRADPEPQVRFVEFGDSALMFEVRVFISNVDHGMLVKDELHTAIDRAFREAGIEIPFPQRDIRVRSIGAAPPLAAAVQPRPDGPGAPSPRPRGAEVDSNGDA